MSTTTCSAPPAAIAPDLCSGCDLDPCACDYKSSLAPGGKNAHLRDVAAEQYPRPLPHRAACPCPICWSARLDTFVARLAALPGRCPHGYAEEQVFHACEIRDVSL